MDAQSRSRALLVYGSDSGLGMRQNGWAVRLDSEAVAVERLAMSKKIGHRRQLHLRGATGRGAKQRQEQGRAVSTHLTSCWKGDMAVIRLQLKVGRG